MSIPTTITTLPTSTGLRLRQLHDVALNVPPATTALPLVYAPARGRWTAQQLGTAGIADGSITTAKLAPGAGGGVDLATGDARWVNVTGDTMSNGLTVAYSGVPRISSFKAAGSLQRPAYDFERWKTTVGTVEAVDVGSSVGTIGFSASSATMLAYGGAIYAFVDAPIVGGDAPISIAFYQSNRQTHIFDSYGRYFLNPPADMSGYATTPGLIVNSKVVGLSATAGNTLTWTTDGFYSNALSAAAADALFLTPAEGNAAYATTAHTHDTAYVNTTGDVMSGGLTISTATAPQIGLSNPTNATGAIAGVNLVTGSGWNTRFGTVQGQWWFAFMDGANTVAWGDDATNLRLVSRSLTLDAGRKIDFADENKDDKVDLYGGSYTLGIRAAQIAYRVPTAAYHNFLVNDVSLFQVASGGVTVLTPNLYFGAGTQAHTFRINSGAAGSATIEFLNNSAALDQKRWEWVGDSSGQMYLRAVNDAYSLAPTAFLIQRSGATITNTYLYGTVNHSNNYAYFGGNGGPVYPAVGAAFTAGWNFTNGSRDVTLWNTDVNNTSVANNPSFVFRQLLSASSRNDLMTIRSNGTMQVVATTSSATPIIGAYSVNTTQLGVGLSYDAINVQTGWAYVSRAIGTYSAGIRVRDQNGGLVGYIPIYV